MERHNMKTDKLQKRRGRVPRSSFLKTLIRNRILLLMLLPSVVLVFLFNYLPMGGLIMAFKRFNYADGIFGSPWVALDNFKFFFQSGKALAVTKNTALYNIAFIAINNILEIAFAVILSEMAGKKLKKLLQSAISLLHFLGNRVIHRIQSAVL